MWQRYQTMEIDRRMWPITHEQSRAATHLSIVRTACSSTSKLLQYQTFAGFHACIDYGRQLKSRSMTWLPRHLKRHRQQVTIITITNGGQISEIRMGPDSSVDTVSRRDLLRGKDIVISLWESRFPGGFLDIDYLLWPRFFWPDVDRHKILHHDITPRPYILEFFFWSGGIVVIILSTITVEFFRASIAIEG